MGPTTGDTTERPGGASMLDAAPADIVRRFLGLLADGDADGACELLAADVDYINVPLPAMRGRERVRRALAGALRAPGTGFEVYFHTVAEHGDTVLTERTDVLLWGPLRMQFWVCGRFDVSHGEITLWKDYFDWVDVTWALLRGLVGIAVPALRAKPPSNGA